MVPLLPVDSQMIAAAGYDTQTRTLYVLFNNGKVYEYYHVPKSEYESLMSAESKGNHMRSQIIDVYPYAVFHGWRHEVES